MGAEVNRQGLVFTKPEVVEMKTTPLEKPSKDEVLVQTTLSAISPGTEMLVYRGQWPAGVATDNTIAALSSSFSYPLSYGYCTVGRVVELGSAVAGSWLDRRGFSFQPHQSHFRTSVAHLFPIPDGLEDEMAIFLPSMETAITLMLDGRPLLGENVLVFGQGIIGLLATVLLAEFPLHSLITLEQYQLRRQASRRLGAHRSLDPNASDIWEQLGAVRGKGGEADLIFELSGNPQCLNDALALSRFTGRVVVGSWYGAKTSELDLGSFFHRGRLTLTSSQVSSLPPDLTGRWHQARRLDLAWNRLRQFPAASLITHRFQLSEAAQAYALIDRDPGTTIQVVFEYL
jgi:2-desacetyl-2-hydroxyethyl bacteriochlorophyllide A dehydrogenase